MWVYVWLLVHVNPCQYMVTDMPGYIRGISMVCFFWSHFVIQSYTLYPLCLRRTYGSRYGSRYGSNVWFNVWQQCDTPFTQENINNSNTESKNIRKTGERKWKEKHGQECGYRNENHQSSILYCIGSRRMYDKVCMFQIHERDTAKHMDGRRWRREENQSVANIWMAKCREMWQAWNPARATRNCSTEPDPCPLHSTRGWASGFGHKHINLSLWTCYAGPDNQEQKEHL